MRSWIERVIVRLALWGLLSVKLAEGIIRSGGMRDA